jgi:membrane fusion protein (multidrug efflux system)
MTKKSVLFFIFITASAVFYFSFFSQKNESIVSAESPKPVKKTDVAAVKAFKGKISETFELTGNVVPYKKIQLSSPAQGPVQSHEVREGDFVKKGEILLSIGRINAVNAEIKALEDELSKERENLRRVKSLVENNAVAGEELDKAKSSFEKVYAALVRARETAGDYIVRAPWNGIVSEVFIKEGEFAEPKVKLIEIYDPSSLVITASVPEKHSVQIDDKMNVHVILDAYPNKEFKGKISRIYPYLDPKYRTRTIEISMDKDIKLLPGMFARLKIELETAGNAVLIPSEAVLKSSTGKTVFTIKDGKAQLVKVETGIEHNNLTQIKSGINPGDTVIFKGHRKLKDNTRVNPEFEEIETDGGIN